VGLFVTVAVHVFFLDCGDFVVFVVDVWDVDVEELLFFDAFETGVGVAVGFVDLFEEAVDGFYVLCVRDLN
jgi:hypothetical protein